jgi:hypothetical protein
MPFEISPGWLSAAASLCSAATALFMMVLNRRNSHDAVRPDLVFGDWKLRNDEGEDEPKGHISVETIRNLGKGTAKHIWMEMAVGDPFRRELRRSLRKPIHVRRMRFKRITHLFPNEERTLSGEGEFHWKDGRASVDQTNSKPRQRYIGVEIYLTYWDNLGYRYELREELLVTNGVMLAGCEELAPCIGLVERRVTRRRSWIWRGRVGGSMRNIDRLTKGRKLVPLLRSLETQKKSMQKLHARVEAAKERVEAAKERIEKATERFFSNDAKTQRIVVTVRTSILSTQALKSLVSRTNSFPFEGRAAGTVLLFGYSAGEPGFANLILAFHPENWETAIRKSEEREHGRLVRLWRRFLGKTRPLQSADFGIISEAKSDGPTGIRLDNNAFAVEQSAESAPERAQPVDRRLSRD